MRFSAWSSDVCSSDLAHDASSVRATLFIDPDGVLQASTCYPATVGRSVDEMLRTVAALQRVHDGSALAPVDWRPGDDVLRVPAQSVGEVFAGETPRDWFYATMDAGAGRRAPSPILPKPPIRRACLAPASDCV